VPVLMRGKKAGNNVDLRGSFTRSLRGELSGSGCVLVARLVRGSPLKWVPRSRLEFGFRNRNGSPPAVFR